MSNAIKWGILAAAVVALVALIVVLPFNQYINVNQFSSAIAGVTSICANAFKFARGLVNNFFSPFGRSCITGLMFYWIGGFFVKIAIKLVAWVQHFIFRG